MDPTPDSLSMLLAAVMICMIALGRWWQPAGSFWRHALALTTIGIGALYFLHLWSGWPVLPLDRRLAFQIGTVIGGIGTLGLLAWAVRVFVTDYRRTTAERLVREAQS